MRDHPIIYVNDMSTLMTRSYGESSGNPIQQHLDLLSANQNPNLTKKKRSLPGNPDPDAEVVALSPRSLLATNRFVCEICNKGFQRDQNLQLHRRGHNLPWKLKQKSDKEVRKKVYICPEVSCVHHDPSRALGDLTGIKKHFCRKHWEKKWACERCSKKYAVRSDWKAHIKICGTKEYRCNCGTLFSRRDSFTTHRAFCDALAHEKTRSITFVNPLAAQNSLFVPQQPLSISRDNQYHIQPAMMQPPTIPLPGNAYMFHEHNLKTEEQQVEVPSWPSYSGLESMDSPCARLPSGPPYPMTISPHMSATALLHTAAQIGVTTTTTRTKPSHNDKIVTNGSVTVAMGVDGRINEAIGDMLGFNRHEYGAMATTGRRKEECSSGSADGLTRDFLGLKRLYSGDMIDMAGLDYDQMRLKGGAWNV